MDDCQNERPAAAGGKCIRAGKLLGMRHEGGVFYRIMEYPGDPSPLVQRWVEGMWLFYDYAPPS